MLFKKYIFLGFTKWGLELLPLDRHITITGPTRSGKTRLAQKIIKRLKVPALILDWHGEYGGVKIRADRLKIEFQKMDKKLLSEILGMSLNLSEASIYFLYRAIRGYDINNIRDVVSALDDFLVTTKSEVEMKAAIARRLEYVIDVFEKGTIPIDVLFKTRKTVSIDLSRLKLYEEKILVSLFILTSLYNYLFESGITKSINKLLIIDEAQNIIKRGDVVKYLIFESAKFGLRVVIITNELPPQDILVHSYLIITRPHYIYNLKTKNTTILKDYEIKELWII
ncbi:MAG: DUF87 domain-containing protein [Pyrobaculum sp.]